MNNILFGNLDGLRLEPQITALASKNLDKPDVLDDLSDNCQKVTKIMLDKETYPDNAKRHDALLKESKAMRPRSSIAKKVFGCLLILAGCVGVLSHLKSIFGRINKTKPSMRVIYGQLLRETISKRHYFDGGTLVCCLPFELPKY